MTIITRTWKKAHPDTLWSIWDGGNEFWELKDGILRHFSVIDRYKEGDIIIEKVQLLQESPIPLEVVRQTILGWEVMEEAEAPIMIQPPQQKQRRQAQEFVEEWARGTRQPQAQLQAPAKAQAQVPRVQTQAQVPRAPVQVQSNGRKGAFQPLTRGPAFLPDTPEDASEHPPPQTQSQPPAFSHNSKKDFQMKSLGDIPEEGGTPQEQDVCSDALKSQEAFSQDSYTPPTELWSALSQWIPPNALFQPSLHHQAFLELSGTQEKSYPGKKDSESNLRQKEARHPYLAPSRNSRPYQPKTFAQQPKVAGPLFI